ncbi:MAG: T9SS type A sorting domain-containing protein [Bacteroidota bacterium]
MRKTIFLVVIVLHGFLCKGQWITLSSFLTGSLTAISFPTNDTGYFCQDDGIIKKTTDGMFWNYVGPQLPIKYIHFLSRDTGFAMGAGGIFKTTNGGVSWSDVFVDSVMRITSICFPSSGIGYAIGIDLAADVAIYKSTDMGNSWTLISTVSMIWFNDPDIEFSDSNTGYFATNCYLYKTTNGGLNWTLIYTEPNFGDFRQIQFLAQDTGFIAGGYGVYRTTNGGSIWSLCSLYSAHAISMVSATYGFATALNGVYKTSNGGNTWIYSTNAYNVSTDWLSIHFPSKNIGYVCGENGEIKKYHFGLGIEDDAGEVDLQIYPNPSNGVFEINCKGQVIQQLCVRDISGKVMVNNSYNDQEIEIDLTALNAGIYFLSIRLEEGNFTKKVIIQ